MNTSQLVDVAFKVFSREKQQKKDCKMKHQFFGNKSPLGKKTDCPRVKHLKKKKKPKQNGKSQEPLICQKERNSLNEEAQGLPWI